jgi:hypothetical protein
MCSLDVLDDVLNGSYEVLVLRAAIIAEVAFEGTASASVNDVSVKVFFLRNHIIGW